MYIHYIYYIYIYIYNHIGTHYIYIHTNASWTMQNNLFRLQLTLLHVCIYIYIEALASAIDKSNGFWHFQAGTFNLFNSSRQVVLTSSNTVYIYNIHNWIDRNMMNDWIPWKWHSCGNQEQVMMFRIAWNRPVGKTACCTVYIHSGIGLKQAWLGCA